MGKKTDPAPRLFGFFANIDAFDSKSSVRRLYERGGNLEESRLPAPIRPKRARNSPASPERHSPSAVKYPNVLRMSSDSSANPFGVIGVIRAMTSPQSIDDFG